MKITWKNETRKIKDLIPADYNPRQLTEKQAKQLKKSLEKFDLAEPVVINKDNTIIGGHQRLHIMSLLGKTECDVRVPAEQISPELERELNLRLNKNTGEWDWDALANNFELDFLKEVGFDDKELDKLLGIREKNDDDFELEKELEATTGRAKLGEVWQLGRHKLIVGDSCDPATYRKLMGNEKAELIFTDPPYNIAYEGGMNTTGQNKRSGIKNDKMSTQDFSDFLRSFIVSAMEYSTGCWYICMSSKELDSLKRNFEEAGGHWQSFIIWVKNTFTLSRSDWQNQYEPILYGWNGNIPSHYFVGWRDEPNVWEDLSKVKPSFKDGKTYIKVGEYQLELEGKVEGKLCRKKDQTDIWREKKPSKSSEHPTMKPIALVERAILASSKHEDIVLDPFLGSGTTLVACENLNRKCYGIELDEKYAEVIIKRWEEKTGNKAVKIA